MSLLAHAVYGARGMEVERRNLDQRIRDEVDEAKRIHLELGCTWSEALVIANQGSSTAACPPHIARR